MEDSKKTLYQKFKDAGIVMDNYESDLYVQDSQMVQDILKNHRLKNDGYPKSVRKFTESQTKQVWLDIPFGYEPFWENKNKKHGISEYDESASPS